MSTILILAFCIGYLLITFEEKVRINKAAIAILTGGFLWSVYILFYPNPDEIVEQLVEHVGNISQIIFFLIGAMTIVELIDSYNGFAVITKLIKTDRKRTLMAILAFITFFLSAVLDNLTTTIIMVTLLRKLLHDKNERLLFVGVIVIAANSGGAWTPMGDVTTTMLWIGGQITTLNIMKQLFLPSLLSMVVPLLIISRMIKGDFKQMEKVGQESTILKFEQRTVFFMGIGALIFVPIFKSITHLPPFMGMLIGLSILWVVTELLNKNKIEGHKITVSRALEKIDTPSILFFLGILLAVAALESTHMLVGMANILSESVDYLPSIAIALGLLSAIIDNVPLVAAIMGMYDLNTYPPDHYFWELIAYCAGTGGSILIIGSAAGVAAMGIEKIDFFWYLKKISLAALIGYLSGAFLYILLL